MDKAGRANIRFGERIMSRSNGGSGGGGGRRGPARNLFTPENYNGASATREFVPLLAPSLGGEGEGEGEGEGGRGKNKYTERIRGVGKKVDTVYRGDAPLTRPVKPLSSPFFLF